MNILITDLRNKFDYIIFDTPPVAIVTDSLLLTKYADTSLFVVRQNFSSKEVIGLADNLVERGSFKQLNILINDTYVKGYYGYSLKYGYNYGYNYNYSYGYYSEKSDYYSDNDDSNSKRSIKERIKKLFGA